MNYISKSAKVIWTKFEVVFLQNALTLLK